MIKSHLILAAGAFMVAAIMLPGQSSAENFPPIRNQTVITECGDCHMAFFAEMLPRESWLRILNNLENHYGEDASIEPAQLKEVIAFHTSRAADVLDSHAARKWRKGLKKGEVPDRITTAPRFIHEHDDNEFRYMWTKFKVTTKADCVACHRDANKGLFDDD